MFLGDGGKFMLSDTKERGHDGTKPGPTQPEPQPLQDPITQPNKHHGFK